MAAVHIHTAVVVVAAAVQRLAVAVVQRLAVEVAHKVREQKDQQQQQRVDHRLESAAAAVHTWAVVVRTQGQRRHMLGVVAAFVDCSTAVQRPSFHFVDSKLPWRH